MYTKSQKSDWHESEADPYILSVSELLHII